MAQEALLCKLTGLNPLGLLRMKPERVFETVGFKAEKLSRGVYCLFCSLYREVLNLWWNSVSTVRRFSA